jgi:hypothetical protein
MLFPHRDVSTQKTERPPLNNGDPAKGKPCRVNLHCIIFTLVPPWTLEWRNIMHRAATPFAPVAILDPDSSLLDRS